MKKLLLVLLTVSISVLTLAQPQSLTSEQLSAFKTLIKEGHIEYYSGSEQIVRINPDIWNLWSFTERKGFTENLCTYICKYVKGISKVDDWFVQIENMATGKKLARLTMIFGYKEFN